MTQCLRETTLPTINQINPSPSPPFQPPRNLPETPANDSVQDFSDSSVSCDIDALFSLRTTFQNNPLIGFLNINSLRNKIIDLRVIVERCLPDILVIEETKLSSDFKTENFLISNYQKPLRKDRNENGGGLMQFVRKGMVCNRIPSLEPQSLEIICSELVVNKTKWIIYSLYRPPEISNIDLFFENLSTSLNNALDKYGNVILMGDINIDTSSDQDLRSRKLVSFCDVFGLSNLVTQKTCFTKTNSSSIDVILTNKPRCFKKTSAFETGLSDYHSLVLTVMKCQAPRLKTKKICYRSYKKFDSQLFREDVKNANFALSNNPEESYNNLTSTFQDIVEKHAPSKSKLLRGNTAPFMTPDLRKAIYTRSRLKNRFNKNPTKENEASYKKQRNKCVSLRKKAIKIHFKKATKYGIMDSQAFWKLVKPFLSNKGGLEGSDISLIKNDRIITNDEELANIFNDHYINIVEKSSGKKPCGISDTVPINDDRQIVRFILEKYQNHPSVLAIIQNPETTFTSFAFKEVRQSEVLDLLQSFDIKNQYE